MTDTTTTNPIPSTPAVDTMREIIDFVRAEAPEAASTKSTTSTGASSGPNTAPARANSSIGQLFAGALLGGLAAHGVSALGSGGLGGLDEIGGANEDPERAELRRRADAFDRIEEEIELAGLLFARGHTAARALDQAREFYRRADEYRVARRAEVQAEQTPGGRDSGEETNA